MPLGLCVPKHGNYLFPFISVSLSISFHNHIQTRVTNLVTPPGDRAVCKVGPWFVKLQRFKVHVYYAVLVFYWIKNVNKTSC